MLLGVDYETRWLYRSLDIRPATGVAGGGGRFPPEISLR